MTQSIRLLYRKVQGRTRYNFNWGPITERSAVLVTAAEYSHAGGGGGSFPNSVVFNPLSGRTHLGAADVYVTNIGVHGPEPGEGGVEFHLHANHDFPIDVAVTITVLDEIPDENWVFVQPG